MSSIYTDGVTPLDAIHMNALQQKIEKDVASGYVGLNASGQIVLGGDTNLYRGGAGILQTDSSLYVKRASGTATAFGVGVFGSETQPRFYMDASGKLNWGTGAAFDTTLYRSAASTLRTDGNLVVVGGPSYNPGLKVDGTTNPGHLIQGMRTTGDAQPVLAVDRDGGIYWGPGGGTGIDISITRAAAGALQVNGVLNINGSDAQLQRTGSYALFTNANFTASGSITANQGVNARYGQASNVGIGDIFGNNQAGIFFGWGSVGSAIYQPIGQNNNVNVYWNSAWGNINAASFSVQSDRSTKAEVEEVHPYWHETLLKAGIYRYERDDTGEKHLGLMSDELPVEVVNRGVVDAETTHDMVDLYKLTTALLATVQHLATRLETVEAKTA